MRTRGEGSSSLREIGGGGGWAWGAGGQRV